MNKEAKMSRRKTLTLLFIRPKIMFNQTIFTFCSILFSYRIYLHTVELQLGLYNNKLLLNDECSDQLHTKIYELTYSRQILNENTKTSIPLTSVRKRKSGEKFYFLYLLNWSILHQMLFLSRTFPF